MKIIRLFSKILVTILCVAYLLWLTLANRDINFDFKWNPLHDQILHLSLPLALFLAIVAGFVWGSFILWINMSPLRDERNKFRKRIDQLERQLQEKQHLQKTVVVDTVSTDLSLNNRVL